MAEYFVVRHPPARGEPSFSTCRQNAMDYIDIYG